MPLISIFNISDAFPAGTQFKFYANDLTNGLSDSDGDRSSIACFSGISVAITAVPCRVPLAQDYVSDGLRPRFMFHKYY